MRAGRVAPQLEPSGPFCSAVSISADFESDFCKIRLEISATKTAKIIQLFQIHKTEYMNGGAKFRESSLNLVLPLVPVVVVPFGLRQAEVRGALVPAVLVSVVPHAGDQASALTSSMAMSLPPTSWVAR